MARNGAVVAASGRRSITIEDWLRENTQAPGFAVRVRFLDTAVPYLSAGLFLCRSASFLADWERTCDALPFELLYEQNAFNLTAWAQPDRVHLLNPDLWNLSGQDILRTACVPDGAGFALESPSGRVHVLHVTSTNRMADLVPVNVDITTHGRSCVLPYRIVRHPDALRDHQIGLFSSGLERELPALVDSGCLDDPPLA